MKRIYLSHPFGGNEENREKAGRISTRFSRLWAKDGEYVIVNPLKELSNVPEENDDKILMMAVDLMKSCDGVIFAPGWKRSRGCRLEHMIARRHNIPRILLDEDVAEVLAS